MKIAVNLTIDLTPAQIEGLALEYGLGDGAKVPAPELREWAKEYVLNHVQQSAAFYDGAADVTAR